MLVLLRYIQPIAFLLAILIFLQSCVAYDSIPTTIERATEEQSRMMKITTVNGKKYILHWMEQEGTNLVSIKNTTRAFFDREEVLYAIMQKPAYKKVTIEEALGYKGDIQLVTTNEKKEHIVHPFFEISQKEGYIIGYSMINQDTSTVVIPTNQIEKIQLMDEAKSKRKTRNLAIGLSLGLAALAIMAIGLASIDYTSGWSFSN